MERYVLRRDNVETGPYSLSEIIDKGLLPFDLIWVENGIDSWQYPSQVQELKDHIRITNSIGSPCLSPYDAPQEEVESLEGIPTTLVIANPPKAIKDTQVTKKRRIRLAFAAFLGVAVCFFFTAFLIKNMLEALNGSGSVATKIFQVTQAVPDPTTNNLVQNALAVEVVNSNNKEKAHYPVIMKLKDIRKLVKVKTAEASISTAGSTSTQLFISNESPKLVDKATIQLTYEKRDGEVLKQETFSVPMLRPFYTRVMEIPVDDKDVKVKARILNIYSLHNGPQLRRI